MSSLINNTILGFKSLWCAKASRELFTNRAESDLAEAEKLLAELPTKLEADIAASKAHTERIIEQVKRDGEIAILHLQRQASKRKSDLEFIIATAQIELGEEMK